MRPWCLWELQRNFFAVASVQRETFCLGTVRMLNNGSTDSFQTASSIMSCSQRLMSVSYRLLWRPKAFIIRLRRMSSGPSRQTHTLGTERFKELLSEYWLLMPNMSHSLAMSRAWTSLPDLSSIMQERSAPSGYWYQWLIASRCKRSSSKAYQE